MRRSAIQMLFKMHVLRQRPGLTKELLIRTAFLPPQGVAPLRPASNTLKDPGEVWNRNPELHEFMPSG